MSASVTTDVPASGAKRDVRDPLMRLAQLFDGDDWELLDSANNTEVQTAAGRINGTRTIAYCTDATKMGGVLGAAGARRIVEAIEIAIRQRCPVIGYGTPVAPALSRPFR